MRRGWWLGLIIAVGCQKAPNPAPNGTPPAVASQIMENFDMIDTQNGQRNMTLHAAQAELFEEKHLAQLEKPDVVFLKQGKPSSRLVAPKGKVDTESHQMEAWGGVTVTTVDSDTLTTERLQYDPKRNLIHTELPVHLVRPDSVTDGIGLESDPGLQRIQIGHEKVRITK